MTTARPTLSLRERDRRWHAVRELLAERDLDALFVGAFRGRDHFEAYLIDDQVECAVVFPRVGEPVVHTWYPPRVSRAAESERSQRHASHSAQLRMPHFCQPKRSSSSRTSTSRRYVCVLISRASERIA